jgi:hypothetical protein
MPSAENPQRPSDAFARLQMWDTAATDPIAAASICAGYLVSEVFGERFGFEQDPVKAAASGKAAAEVAKVALALGVAFTPDTRTQSKNDGVAKLSAKETDAVKAALGISGKMNKDQKGQAGEIVAGWLLTRDGHQVLGAIQNRSNNGVDLVTAKEGRYWVWEVKSDDAKLSPAQRNPSQWVVTRVYDANRPGHGTYSGAARDLGYRLQDALRDNQVMFGRVRIRFTE